MAIPSSSPICRVVGSTVDVDHAMERDACSLLQQHMDQLQTCTYKSRDTHITQQQEATSAILESQDYQSEVLLRMRKINQTVDLSPTDRSIAESTD